MLFHNVFDKRAAKTTKSENLKKMKHHFRRPVIPKQAVLQRFYFQ